MAVAPSAARNLLLVFSPQVQMFEEAEVPEMPASCLSSFAKESTQRGCELIGRRQGGRYCK